MGNKNKKVHSKISKTFVLALMMLVALSFVNYAHAKDDGDDKEDDGDNEDSDSNGVYSVSEQRDNYTSERESDDKEDEGEESKEEKDSEWDWDFSNDFEEEDERKHEKPKSRINKSRTNSTQNVLLPQSNQSQPNANLSQQTNQTSQQAAQAQTQQGEQEIIIETVEIIEELEETENEIGAQQNEITPLDLEQIDLSSYDDDDNDSIPNKDDQYQGINDRLKEILAANKSKYSNDKIDDRPFILRLLAWLGFIH